MFEWLHKPIRELITFIQDLIHVGKRELWDFDFFFPLCIILSKSVYVRTDCI